jgi:glycosyltransferase involved in cell wall biosynthesis
MPEPLRVLQICAGFSLESLGGVERYTFDLSRALSRLGVQVSIAGLWLFGTQNEGDWMRRLADEGIPTFAGVQKDDRAPLRNLVDSIQQLRRSLAARTFDVVHSQQEFGDVAALLIKRSVHARVLARSVHNDPEWRNRPLRRLLLSQTACPVLFQVESGITQRIANRLNGRLLARVMGRHAHVIHNAIDLSRFAGPAIDKQAARRRLNWPAEALIVGSVGRLSEQKGYSDLVHAAARVRQHIPHARFHIVGAGELRDTLQGEIDALQLNGVVTLDGTKSNMNDVYAGMDVFVSSSLWEGLPTVLLEAMTAGVPIVATAVDGNTDLITHEKTGWLAPARAPDALAEAIMSVLKDQASAGMRAALARDTAAAYHIDKAAAQWLDLYRQHVRQRPNESTQVN